jgi:uncharacterized protein YceK
MNFRAFAVMFAVAMLAGCAAVPTVDSSKPITGNIAQYKSVQVIVDGTDQMRQTAGFEATSAALRDEFTANLRAAGQFTAVGSAAPASGGLVARLVITELNYVHGATRGAVGILAGRAILQVVMTVTEKDTNAVLGEVRASHSSSHAQGVFSPVTSTQVTAIAKEFAQKLSGK